MRSWFVVLPLVVACAGQVGPDGGTGEPTGGGATTTSASNGGAGGVGAAGGTGGQGGQRTPGPDADSCAITFSFAPGFSLSNVRLAGEWHGFDLATAAAMNDDDGDGVFTATVDVAPGLSAYKIVYDADGQTHWIFDPAQGRRKYIDGTENSAVLVRDCNKPALSVVSSDAQPSGSYRAMLSFIDAFDGSGLGSVDAEGADGIAVTVDGEAVAIDVDGLPHGKHTVRVTPTTESGRVGDPLRLVFWIEQEPFDWNGALIYMVMTDRFANGDDGNDHGVTPGADPRGDWHGGDLEGLRQAIAAGRLDELGVRAIWLTPFNQNPAGAYLAADGVTQVTGYHGYWPTRAREVDARLGGAAALEAMVDEAHAHGIRVLMDYVVNHVHEDHEYVSQHPDWFRTGCVCGTAGCDWTSHALECMFRDYMPDIDHRVPEANAQFVDDALWWLERFDLDGLRIDAVKHVEEIATRNLAAAVREGFEAAGTRYFLMGETAMGWNDCADPCNDENYGTIAKYIGPHGLDGQFDFVLYHGVSYRTFAYGDKGMLHADYWLSHGLEKWPDGAIMTPYIGSHDTPRFVSLADYRGQDGAHPRHVPGNQWHDIAAAPGDAEPYRRMRIGLSWLLTQPGAPLLYYGDEYGQWGGADPNNRMMWKDGGFSAEEAATRDHVRQLGTARAQSEALRLGDYRSLGASEDTLSFARTSQSDVAIVALTRLGGGDSITVDSGLVAGTVLSDAMGGPDVTVGQGGMVTIAIPGSGVVILRP